MGHLLFLLALLCAFGYGTGTTTTKAPSTRDIAHWTSKSLRDGHILYSCTGHTVTFDWGYTLTAHDALCDVQWFYHANGSAAELMAMRSHGKFVPLPEFSARLKVEGNAGISLQNVSMNDAGKYSVEVHVYTEPADTHTLLERDALLVVSDQLMTTDGSLHVTKTPKAVLNPDTDEWSNQLECGRFIFDQDPPFGVEWETPAGKIVQSSNFSAGYFNLLLENPIEGGNYSCRIPSRHAYESCLPSEGGKGEATYSVDKVDGRLALVEKENHQLKKLLEEMMRTFKAAVRPLVAFHARNLASSTPSSGTPLVFNEVQYNSGKAYSGSTGYFVTPVNGTYMFIATTGSYGGSTVVRFDLSVDNSLFLGAGYNYNYGGHYTVSSVHAIVHLQVGQKVWVKSHGSTYHSFYSSFSGFLFAYDID